MFLVKQVTLEVKSFGFTEMKETTGPVTQHHIPEDFNSNNCVRTTNLIQICLACECSKFVMKLQLIKPRPIYINASLLCLVAVLTTQLT